MGSWGCPSWKAPEGALPRHCLCLPFAGLPWTEDEHRSFLVGLKKLGKVCVRRAALLQAAPSSVALVLGPGVLKQACTPAAQGDWRGISRHHVPTRTPTQVASHAQKYYIRQMNLHNRRRRSSLFDMAADTDGVCPRGTLSPGHARQQAHFAPFTPALSSRHPHTCTGAWRAGRPCGAVVPPHQQKLSRFRVLQQVSQSAGGSEALSPCDSFPQHMQGTAPSGSAGVAPAGSSQGVRMGPVVGSQTDQVAPLFFAAGEC